jgi:acyl carrier protein
MDSLESVLSTLGKSLPDSEDVCLYKSGFIDSFELMQIVLELELLTGKHLDISELVAEEVSLKRLRVLLNV